MGKGLKKDSNYIFSIVVFSVASLVNKFRKTEKTKLYKIKLKLTISHCIPHYSVQDIFDFLIITELLIGIHLITLQYPNKMEYVSNFM